jgi:hypothetical protein
MKNEPTFSNKPKAGRSQKSSLLTASKRMIQVSGDFTEVFWGGIFLLKIKAVAVANLHRRCGAPADGADERCKKGKRSQALAALGQVVKKSGGSYVTIATRGS